MRGSERPRWLAIAALLLALAACHRSPRFVGTNITGVPWGGNFTLTRQNGAPFDTDSLRGRVVLIYFGYTRCTDVCEPTLRRLARLVHRLGSAAARTRVVFVSIDPRHDTPERIRKFLDHIDPQFIGLTGTPSQIARVVAQFKVADTRNAEAPPAGRFTHSDGIYVEDPSGRLRLYVPGTTPLRGLAHDIRRLLAGD
ncbi:MAG: SCO family protein [Acidiferrobacteraceae bacterium]